MREESVRPWEDWLRPFDQDAEEEKHWNQDAEEEKQRNQDAEEEKQWEKEGDEEEEYGAARPNIRDISKEPTDKEIEEHYMHHSEFRQWCPHCVKGKAVSYGSRRKKDSDDGLPMISIDYMFMGDQQGREEEKGMPTLVMKDRRTKVLWARVVPAKGVNAHAVKQLAKQITLLGHKRILFKSDGEAAIKALKGAVKNELNVDVAPEESPVGDHAANGDVESAVRQVQGQIRTMKDALESRYGERIARDSHILPWLVMHAAATITRYRKDADGITAYRRWKGKEFKRAVAEFGENVWYLKSDSAGKNKYANRWQEGIWLGITDDTGESIVGTDEGVVKAKDFRRKPIIRERWNKERLAGMKGVPWKTSVHEEGDELRIQISMPSDDGPLSELVKSREVSDPRVKRFRINPRDIQKYGYTKGCLGCKCLSRGQPAQSHNEACRARITEELKKEGDARLEREKTRKEAEEEENARKKRKAEEEADYEKTGSDNKRSADDRSDNKRSADDRSDNKRSADDGNAGGDNKRSKDVKGKREGEDAGGDQKRTRAQKGGLSSSSSGLKRPAEDLLQEGQLSRRIRDKEKEVEQSGMDVAAVCEELRDDAIREHYDMEARGAYTVTAYETEYFDNLSGEKLDAELVKKARAEEMKEFEKYGVYKKVSMSECYAETNKEPIGVRWVDVNKGDAKKPEYRSRLVAQEIKKDKRPDLFAAMPPLEAKRLLYSMMMSGDEKEGITMDFIDVRRAYLHAKAIRDVYIKLPDEDHEEGMCGKLIKALYGTRDAAQCWEREYVKFMTRIGFVCGKSSPCIFWHAEKGIRAVVHGDDFTIMGQRDELDWFRAEMRKSFTIKVKARLGPDERGELATRILNRIVEYGDNVLYYEADQRHAEDVINGMGLHGESKTVVTPGISGPTQAGKITMNDSQFRMLAARCNYLAQDRPDIQYAAKEICRKMSAPDEAAWGQLKRLARYLAGESRVVYAYHRQPITNEIVVWSDTDFAGCKETRKSTNGGAIMLGGHCVKTWSSTQAKIALSSGEAEYSGIVKAISEGMGIQSMMKDLGYDLKLVVNTDSTAAIGIGTRHGLGKVKHMDIKELWIQEKVMDGDVKLNKVPGNDNLADLMTKHLDRGKIDEYLEKLSIQRQKGRHALAPVL